MSRKTFSIALMDPPYESENLTTAFRILGAMAQRGHNINVFAYEGAAGLAFAKQAPHPNPVHGKNLAEKTTPRPRSRLWPCWRLPRRTAARSTG
jgi:tRNA 2-thiouridine synthesizing protein D